MKEFSFYNWTTGGKPEQIQGLFLWWIVNKKRGIIKCKNDTRVPFDTRKVLLTCTKDETLTKCGSQTNGTRHWHDWCMDWALKTAGISSYIGLVIEQRAADITMCVKHRWIWLSWGQLLSVELFNSVFTIYEINFSVIVDILFHFYLYCIIKLYFFCNKMFLTDCSPFISMDYSGIIFDLCKWPVSELMCRGVAGCNCSINLTHHYDIETRHNTSVTRHPATTQYLPCCPTQHYVSWSKSPDNC